MKYRGVIFFITGLAASLALGWFVFPLALYKTEHQPMQFSHKTHAGEAMGMACEDCHAFTTEGRFVGIPATAKCGECHAAQLGETEDERILVEEYVLTEREIPWKIYSRQPDNAFFPHAVHVKTGEMKCEDCHGTHGESDNLRPFQVNRISGYSRDIWGQNISGFASQPWEGMKMDRCVRCHQHSNRVTGCIECHK